MTRSTAHVGETERQDLIGSTTQAYFVAVRTRNCGVRPAERVACLPVHRQGESRLMEIPDGMAAFTFVLIGGTGKLAVMGVLVAVRAGREFHLINRVLPCRLVALVAFHLDVLAFERITGCVMLLRTKEGWLPTFHRVTFCALTLFWA